MTSLFLVLCGCFDVCSVIAQQTSSNGWSYTTADRWGTQYPSCALDSMQSPIPIPFSSLLPSDDIYLRIHSTGLTFTCVVNEDTFPTLVIRPKLNSPPVLLLSSQSREELQLTLITFHKPSAHQHPLSVAPQAEVTLFFEPTYLYSEEEQSRVAVSFFIGIHEASSSVMEMNPYNVNSNFLEKALENWVAGAEVQLTRSDMQSLLHNSVYEYIGSQPFPPCLPLRWYISTELLYTRSTLVAKIQDNSARPLQPRNFRRVRLRTVRDSELADPFTELNAFSNSLYHQIAPSKEHNEEPVRTEYIASVVVLTILVAFLLGLMVLITFFDITPQSSRPIHPMESPDFTNIEQESDEYEEEEEEEEEEENDGPSHVK